MILTQTEVDLINSINPIQLTKRAVEHATKQPWDSSAIAEALIDERFPPAIAEQMRSLFFTAEYLESIRGRRVQLKLLLAIERLELTIKELPSAIATAMHYPTR